MPTARAHPTQPYLPRHYYDSVGELGDVGPTRPRGRDKSGPYALAIASLGLFWQFANRVYYTPFEHSKSSLYNWQEGSLWLVREQPEGACPQSRLRTIVHSQFREETAHVTLDRLDRDD
jgi:hypothetical protein